MLKVSYARGESTNSSNQHTTKLPKIVHVRGRLVSGCGSMKSEESIAKRGRKKVTKKVSFVNLEKKARAEEPDECPYKWIAEDTLYLRQYGHHLVKEKKDDGENSDVWNPDELEGDLCCGQYHCPTYRHIPGGYKSHPEYNSSGRRGSNSYSFFTSTVGPDTSSLYSSPHSSHSRRRDSCSEEGGNSSQKKSFLPPIDPQIISVKKKYGLL